MVDHACPITLILPPATISAAMHRAFPRSLLWFVVTGAVMLLQMFSITGIVLMFALAMLWSIVFINLGMIGTAWEALTGRVSRLWLILPLSFYGGYYAFAVSDHLTLARLRAETDAANARIHIPFDPAKQVLGAEAASQGSFGGATLLQDYGLPVFYQTSADHPEGYRATRIVDAAICTRVRDMPPLSGAGIWSFGVIDRDGGKSGKLNKRFCQLTQPERPTLPIVTVALKEDRSRAATLPVRAVTTRVAMPGGTAYQLRGGTASPLRWLPMPVMGCGLNSGAPSWDCDAGFLRADFTPLVSGSDVAALAAALGLKRVAPENRRAADPATVNDLIARAEADALARDIAAFDRVAADPAAKVDSIPFRVLGARPDALDPRADAIMAALEHAAAVEDRYAARDNGRNLARLLTRLPPDRFRAFGPRVIALYARADPGEKPHWLWESDDLVNRLGDLGPAALPLLTRPAFGRNPPRLWSVEASCRLGPAARPLASLLYEQWAKTRDFDRDERTRLYVAMRRIGLTVPPLTEDKRDQFDKLRENWADITPQSPPRVCAVRAEEQARREEKYSGKRKTNLD